MHFPPHGLKKRQLSVPFRVLHIWTNFFQWLKHSVLWTIFKGVLIIRVDRTNFDVVTRQIEKVHRGRSFTKEVVLSDCIAIVSTAVGRFSILPS